MLANVKLDASSKRHYILKLQTLLVMLFFEWYSQNKVGNIGIFILWRDRENSIVLLSYPIRKYTNLCVTCASGVLAISLSQVLFSL